MENFMDKLYSKLGAGTTQQYTSDMEHKKKVYYENRMEALSNLIRENDSKQLECIAAMMAQEGDERQQSKAEIIQEIRSIVGTLERMQTELSYGPEPTPVSGEVSEERLQALEEHIHKENVKCYRNVQASVMEQAELQAEETHVTAKPIKGMLIALIVLSLANMGVLIVHILGLI